MSEGTISLSDESAPQIDELLTAEEARKLKDSHGEFTAVRTKGGVAAFRSPTRGEYARYNALLLDEKTRAKAFEALVCQCVVSPSRQIFESWLDKSPGITQTCLEAVLKLAGVDTEAQTKKYSPA
jgi:hypothetical protein